GLSRFAASRAFPSPWPYTVSTPAAPRSLALLMTALATSADDAVGATAHTSAATAAACGDAMDVPSSRVHVSNPNPNDTCTSLVALSDRPSACEMKVNGMNCGTALGVAKTPKAGTKGSAAGTLS